MREWRKRIKLNDDQLLDNQSQNAQVNAIDPVLITLTLTVQITLDEELKIRKPSEEIKLAWPQIPAGFIPFKDCF